MILRLKLYPWVKSSLRAIQAIFILNWTFENVIDIKSSLGQSMYPTLFPWGDYILTDKLSYRLLGRQPERGEIVVFKKPTDRESFVCKRVLGLSGDTIRIDPTHSKKNASNVNDNELIVVPPNHIWVVGDNASGSIDSRDYGPVSVSLVQGRILARVWPNFTYFAHKDTMERVKVVGSGE